MDDLSGLDWNTTANNNNSKPPTTANPTYSYPSLRPTPSPSNSGRSTPQAAFQGLSNVTRTTPKPFSKPSTPANDSFAGLLSGGANKVHTNLSLQERQKQLLEEKARQEAENRSKLESHYGSQHGAFWDGLGARSGASSGISTPSMQTISPPPGAGPSSTIKKPFAGTNGGAPRKATQSPELDDILAAFNSSAPVDASSHFPPPQNASNGRSTPATLPITSKGPAISASSKGQFDFSEDDDPFGLNQMKQKSTSPAPPPPTNNDDDILGMLGRPVSEIPRPEPKPAPVERISPQSPDWTAERQHDLPKGPADKAVAELVDMGFPADKAAIALAQTESGIDVQGAVGILLNQAHEEAKQKSQGRQSQSERTDSTGPDTERRSRPLRETRDPSMPSWMREEDEHARPSSRTKDNRSPAPEKDVTKYAQDIGSTLFKSANSLWKTSQKKVQKAVAEFQQDGGDSSQPKWMREAQLRDEGERQGNDKKGKGTFADVTDEAAMLESGAGRPSKAAKQAPPRASQNPFQDEKLRMQSPSIDSFSDRASPQLRMQQRGAQQMPARPAQKLSRQEVEEQAAEVIVSSSRRRRPAPQSGTPPVSAPSTNDLSRPPVSSPHIQSRNPFANGSKPATPNTVSKPQPVPIPTRPKAPPRNIPQVSPSALSVSASHRQNGSEAFKRGDYSAAHEHYTTALRGIPTSHPVIIIIMCNRALTNIKVGDPKAAVSDAESALSVIGLSRGDGEKIAPGGSEGEKDMKDFYGKALMRKAEALENMEKWNDAAKVWKDAVEAGVGGNISIQGRNRCEKAGGGTSARPSPAPRSAAARKPPPPKPRPSALADLNGGSLSQHEAVNKLREANAAAEKADDEKFALTDTVDAKLIAWKGTKTDNIRALLGSLDKVLWEGSGWNKVGMQDLVMPNKVKICYMKAIAKVHPDKISQNATTEQKMISASVFSTLNEAWDKFKKDNNL
ncbi:uba ts-n domain protein [Venturia nashicola]|uniref:Uba ts-n domain protein n=1 Tax=Venturia nashicola TaxID=86259 RepID=A0A4Z1PCT5_9PEZI|nr:uba ts-n domain protein [Venturia nashicola]